MLRLSFHYQDCFLHCTDQSIYIVEIQITGGTDPKGLVVRNLAGVDEKQSLFKQSW